MKNKSGKMGDIFIVGEIMVETWNQIPYHATINSTVKIELSFNFLGGMAANSAVALAGLGLNINLISHFGGNALQFLTAFSEKGISLEYCSESAENSSMVFAFFNEKGYQHYHLLSPEPQQINPKVHGLFSQNTDMTILLTGGHYEYFRKIYLDIVQHKLKKKIIFSPSYALYSFTQSELEEIIRNSDFLILPPNGPRAASAPRRRASRGCPNRSGRSRLPPPGKG